MPILRNIIASFSPRDRSVQRVYDRCVAVARDAEHYGPSGVPDSVDGRFDQLVLHLCIAAHRLGRIPPHGDALVRSLVEAFIRDMDSNLREMGAGDIGVAKRIKYMAQALHGQMQACGQALDEGPDALRATLARTVAAYSGNEAGMPGPVPDGVSARLAGYVLAQVEALAAVSDADCLAADFRLLPAADAYRRAESVAA